CAQKNLKGFSLSLFNFQGSFRTPLSSRSLECLHIISNSNEFVNTFFQVFLFFYLQTSTPPGVSVFIKKSKTLDTQGFWALCTPKYMFICTYLPIEFF
ncbi:MAG: hypothetical protein IJC90_00335, partial [Clostridia bacterium]|nr:hypothetical protein [Clostridia bacterium]